MRLRQDAIVLSMSLSTHPRVRLYHVGHNRRDVTCSAVSDCTCGRLDFAFQEAIEKQSYDVARLVATSLKVIWFPNEPCRPLNLIGNSYNHLFDYNFQRKMYRFLY